MVMDCITQTTYVYYFFLCTTWWCPFVAYTQIAIMDRMAEALFSLRIKFFWVSHRMCRNDVGRGF
jgi:hypothetical protein